ncbi:MAG: M56 family metallopeptidase, partial [Pseudomonadota bacterium]
VGFLGLFSTVVVARLGYLAINYCRIRRSLDDGCMLRTTSRLKVVASSHVTVPFSTRGVFRYIVVLPADVCRDREAFRMYLGHELQHIRQGDVNAEIVLSLVSPFLILNPGYWFIAGRMRNLAELSCDRAFLARDRMSARDYSLRLLATARRHLAAENRVPRAFGVPLIGRSLPWAPRKSMLKSRIQEIAAHVDDPAKESRMLAGIASVGLTAVILMMAVSFGTAGDWSHERIMLSTVVNLERINEINSLAQRSW